MTPTGPDFPAPSRGHDGGPHRPYGPSEFYGPSGPFRPFRPSGRHSSATSDERDGTGPDREATKAGDGLPIRGIVMDGAGRAHTTRQGRPWPDGDVVAQALTAVIKDGDRISELLDVLSRGGLWLPLPNDGGPVTDGSAIQLPTVVYLGAEFVPAFTSAEFLMACAHGRPNANYVPEPGWSAAGRSYISEPGSSAADRSYISEPGWSVAGRSYPGWMADRVPSTGTGPQRSVPHIVVPAAELARRLPPGLGIALNPGAQASVPIYPEGVTYLAAAEWEAGDARIRLGQPPVEPESLLREVSAGLRPIPAAQQASRAWLSVPGEGEGLIIAVTLDDPADEASQEAVLAAVEHAAGAAGPTAEFPIDVTFPGEREPDDVDRWFAEHAMPFHLK